MFTFLKITYRRHALTYREWWKNHGDELAEVLIWLIFAIGIGWFTLNAILFFVLIDDVIDGKIAISSMSALGLLWSGINMGSAILSLCGYVKNALMAKKLESPDEPHAYFLNKNHPFLYAVVFITGIIGTALTVILVNLFYLMTVLIKWMWTFPRRIKEKNQAFLEQHPKEAAEILKTTLPKAKGKSTLKRL